MVDSANVHAHWAGVIDAAHDRIAHKLDERKTRQLGDVLERFERELGPHLQPFLVQLLDNPAIPEPIRALLGAIAEPAHFTQSLLIGIALGSVISPVLGTATAPFIQVLANEVWPTNPSIPLSPPELALGMIRHNPSMGDPYAEAAKSGIDKGRLDALAYNTGEALAVGELLLLFRRGQISQDRLVTGLRQSRIRDEWLPEVLDLRYAPPGAGTVVTGALKGHLDDTTARRMIGEAGTDPAQYDWLRASAGRPPGIEQMVELWNRGYTTQARVEAAVRQSDINDDFLPEVLNLRWYQVPPRSIVPMLRSGSITEARARVLLSEHGVRPEDQDAFIKEAGHTTVTAVKELTASTVVALYEQKLIDKPTALARLVALKYTAADAALYVELADANVAARVLAAATNRIHALYVSRRIDRARASADLAKVGQTPGAITQLLALWDEEITTQVLVLSMSQVQGGLAREIISLEDFIVEVHARGWHGLDVKILAAEAYPVGKVPQRVMDLDPSKL